MKDQRRNDWQERSEWLEAPQLNAAKILSAFAFFCCCFGLHTNAIAGDDPRPNIILIMADDLGYAELGCYGQKKIRTPHLDQLAAEGMRFTQFYTGSPVCAPARCTLMTGLHAGHAYVRNNFAIGRPKLFRGQMPLPKSTVTVASLLKQAGYATGVFGKWGLGEVGSTGDPLRRGFDRFFGYNCQSHAHNLYPRYLIDDDQHRELAGNTRSATGEHFAPQVIADEMLDFIRQNKDQPFFLYYPTVLPHLALQAPEEDVARYRGQWPETPYEGRSYQHHPTPRACYAAMISFADKQVGRILTLLEELNLAEDTFVIFISDNGTTHLKDEVDYEFFESVGPLRGLKGEMLEGGIRVPMIVRWPGRIAKNTQSSHISANYDILATLTDLIGLDSAPKTDGVSFLPTLLGRTGEQQQHEYLFWDFAGYGGQLAVRMGNWKGVRRDLIKNPDAPLELYDLKNDIGESIDVAAQNPEIVEKLQQIMINGRTEPEVEKFRFGQYRP